MSSIDVYFEDADYFNFPWRNLENLIRELIEEEQKKSGDISIIICSDEYLLKINKQYLNRDYYTDIIAFNYVSGEVISGDLFISLERVRENALVYGVNFEEELYRIVFHGILHLIGYNDNTEEEKVIMKYKENYYLKKRNSER